MHTRKSKKAGEEGASSALDGAEGGVEEGHVSRTRNFLGIERHEETMLFRPGLMNDGDPYRERMGMFFWPPPATSHEIC